MNRRAFLAASVAAVSAAAARLVHRPKPDLSDWTITLETGETYYSPQVFAATGLRIVGVYDFDQERWIIHRGWMSLPQPLEFEVPYQNVISAPS